MAEALKAGVQPEPRAAFLTDPFTSRDLFGVCRGRCLQCGDCGKYLKATADYTISAGDQGRRHPDNDPSITRCSRCGCLPEAHEVAEHEQEREHGNDAFALRRYDAAVTHYSRALELCSTDAALWSNRAAAYLAKGWPQQALHDAERALALRPDWPKAWGRKAAALLQLGQPTAAVEAYHRALQLEQSQGTSSGGSTALREGLRQAQAVVVKQQKAAEAAKQRQQQQQQQQRPQASTAAAAKPPAPPRAAPASSAPRAPTHASSSAAAAQQQSAGSMGSAAPQAAPAPGTAPAAAAAATAQQPQPQMRTTDLMAAWRSLQQQAGEAAATLARLQQQMQAFEALLLAADQPAGTAQQQPLPACEDEPVGNLSAEGSSTEPIKASKEEHPTSGAAVAAGVPSPDTAAPLEASRPLGSPSSGAESSLGSLNSQPASPAAAAVSSEGGTGSPAGRRSAGITLDGAAPSCDSGSDSEVEEVYSELPPAPATATTASSAPAPVPSARPSSGGEGGVPRAAEQQASAASVRLDSEASDRGGRDSGGSASSPGTGPARGSSSSGSSSGTSDEDDSSRSSGETSEGSDVDDDDAWLASVEAARRRLAADGSRMTPPAKAGRRAPKPAQVSGAEDGGLASLRQMCADAEAAAMALDASGTPRASCKACGAEHCPRFRPTSVLSEAALAAVLSQQAAADAGFSTPDACTCCGCPSSTHETPREFATRQARERRQRLRAQRQASGAAAAAATGASAAAAATKGSTAFQPEAVDDRQRRVAAAAERRAAAEAAGDLLQESDCDMLTQQRRTTCSGCASCPGFRLLFRGCDANDPEVMFYCSACGCRSDQHAVDAAWQQHEAAKRAAEAAAAERRQAAAAASSGAAAAARKAEAEAFATLGLPLGADSKSINRAYKRLALQLHPDKQQRVSAAEAEAAAARFVRVAAAYKLLSGS